MRQIENINEFLIGTKVRAVFHSETAKQDFEYDGVIAVKEGHPGHIYIYAPSLFPPNRMTFEPLVEPGNVAYHRLVLLQNTETGLYAKFTEPREEPSSTDEMHTVAAEDFMTKKDLSDFLGRELRSGMLDDLSVEHIIKTLGLPESAPRPRQKFDLVVTISVEADASPDVSDDHLADPIWMRDSFITKTVDAIDNLPVLMDEDWSNVTTGKRTYKVTNVQDA